MLFWRLLNMDIYELQSRKSNRLISGWTISLKTSSTVLSQAFKSTASKSHLPPINNHTVVYSSKERHSWIPNIDKNSEVARRVEMTWSAVCVCVSQQEMEPLGHQEVILTHVWAPLAVFIKAPRQESRRQASRGARGCWWGCVEELTEGVCQGWRCSPSDWSCKAIMGERGEMDSP